MLPALKPMRLPAAIFIGAPVAGLRPIRSAVAVPFLRTGMTEAHTSPLKAFEAMAAGRPIVASDLPSSREVLRHGENALLVPPGSASELASALRSLLADSGLARRLAERAFSDAPAYSWDARGRRINELIEEVR